MNLVWYKIYGVFEKDDEKPLEVWINRNEACDFARTENKILKRKVLKVKPIAIEMLSQNKYLN